MSAMSIIGIDFGNESCFVAAAKSGGIETLANDYSLRATPSYVAFSAKNRILGVAAKNQQITNIKNTIYGFKRLLGRKFDDAVVQEDLKYLPYRVIRKENGSIGIEVNYLNERNVFSPEQCTAMLLTKLRETASDALQVPINDCVVSVPSYFTNAERQALLNAVEIAGLNCLRLFNETTATALAYGIYKQDLPNVDEAPRNVVFVDMGHAALQVFTCAFNRGKLKIIACESEPNIGGRNIDWILADHFCEQFQKNFGVNIKSNSSLSAKFSKRYELYTNHAYGVFGFIKKCYSFYSRRRAFLRLLSEVEKLKKQMSANSTVLPIGIECIMDEKDVSGKMKRADMEVLCAPLMEKIETVFVKCLQSSQLDVNSIHSVEIVGGSSRVPFVKALIEKVFQKTASTTLNQDEAVSRGCALQCAILSPAVKVRDYAVQDIQLYPISLNYDENDKNYQLELFPLYQAIPFTKALTLARNHDFSLSAFYTGPIPFSDNFICSWKVSGIKATDDQHKVKIKFRVNQHGILVLTSAVIYEKIDNSDTEASMDVDSNNGNEHQNQNGPKTLESEAGNAETNESVDEKKTVTDEKLADKKIKPHIVAVNLSVNSFITGVVDNVNQYVEEELKMISNDKLEKERIDSKNALEEYVYDLRNKLTSEDDLYSFVLEKDRASLTALLDEIENWLYDEGEDSNRQTYCDKLAHLKDQGEPIKIRKLEFDIRPRLFEEFSLILQLSQKFIEKWQHNDPKFVHITADEVNKVQNAIQEKSKWLDEIRADFVNLQKHENPRIMVDEIFGEKQSFEQFVTPIIRKPVPKVEEPKAADGQPDKNQQQNAATNAGEQANEDKQPTAAANGEMETE